VSYIQFMQRKTAQNGISSILCKYNYILPRLQNTYKVCGPGRTFDVDNMDNTHLGSLHKVTSLHFYI
jgi:hypothetical protein